MPSDYGATLILGELKDLVSFLMIASKGCKLGAKAKRHREKNKTTLGDDQQCERQAIIMPSPEG